MSILYRLDLKFRTLNLGMECLSFAAASYAASAPRGFVTYEAWQYNIEISCRYFYWDYIKSGRWGCSAKGGEFKSVSLLAAIEGLKPYSKSTINEFTGYKNRNTAAVISLQVGDILYAPYIDNHSYAGAYLEGRRASSGEYDGLTKYVMPLSSGPEHRVVCIGQEVASSDWIRFVCYRSKSPCCS